MCFYIHHSRQGWISQGRWCHSEHRSACVCISIFPFNLRTSVFKKRSCLCFLQPSSHSTLLYKSCKWNWNRQGGKKKPVTDPWPVPKNLQQIADNSVPSCIWIMLWRYRSFMRISGLCVLVLSLCPMAVKMDAGRDNGICREEMRWIPACWCIHVSCRLYACMERYGNGDNVNHEWHSNMGKWYIARWCQIYWEGFLLGFLK